MQGQGMQASYVYTPTTSNARPGFASRTAKMLGVLQVVLGILCIMFQIIAIFILAGAYYIGTGIWTGIFMVLAGSFGIVSSQKKTNCFVVTFMVMSIIAAVASGVYLILITIGMVVEDLYGYHYNYRSTSMGGRLAVDGIMLVLGLLEMAAAIWSSAICCKATCCLPGMGDPYSVPYHVQYVATSSGQQPVMLIAPPSGQPGVVYAIPQSAANQQYVVQGQNSGQVPPTVQTNPQGGATYPGGPGMMVQGGVSQQAEKA